MAVVGDILKAPENGWIRVDSNNTNIIYEGGWDDLADGNTYGSTFKRSNDIHSNAVVKFNFTGTKLRMIALRHGSVYSNSISIFIDDIEHKATLNGNKSAYQTLVFEVLNLKDTEHYVKIINNTNVWINTDAFDIEIGKEIKIYKITEKRLALKNLTTNQHYSLAEKTLIPLPDTSPKNMILYGIEQGKEIRLNVPFDKIKTVIDNGDGTQTIIDKNVTPFSVYDHISENPQVLIYTESTDDITVSTTTEPYDLYDEFGDEVEVLFYTDNETVTEADLILEANWSPVDELEGDFEVVTWSDEPQETAQRVLEMTAIPKPQFVKLVDPKRIYDTLDDVLANDISPSYRDEVRYFVRGADTTEWKVWNKAEERFIVTNTSTHELITKNGMTYDELNAITDSEWYTWNEPYLNIGIFLKDNPRDTIVSVVDNISYQDYLPRHSASIEKSNFYILNTTAKINLEFNGSILNGQLSDQDLTRVQYRVFVNDKIYYPSNGEFTAFSPSPQNIELAINTKDIVIGEWNNIKVEFRDFFGTVDYWSTNFIGTYSGLLFKDVHGNYYSTEKGEILKYLDFGTIIAGQTTVDHEVLLSNTYGYDVENLEISVIGDFPNGLTYQLSKSNAPFIPEDKLILTGKLKNGDETSFFIRLKTELGATPNSNGGFEIRVKADKV